MKPQLVFRTSLAMGLAIGPALAPIYAINKLTSTSQSNEFRNYRKSNGRESSLQSLRWLSSHIWNVVNELFRHFPPIVSSFWFFFFFFLFVSGVFIGREIFDPLIVLYCLCDSILFLLLNHNHYCDNFFSFLIGFVNFSFLSF